MKANQDKIDQLKKMMADAGYELYPKDAENDLGILALAVSGLVDQGVEVDEAYDFVFGEGRFDKLQQHVLAGL